MGFSKLSSSISSRVSFKALNSSVRLLWSLRKRLHLSLVICCIVFVSSLTSGKPTQMERCEKRDRFTALSQLRSFNKRIVNIDKANYTCLYLWFSVGHKGKGVFL